jgi:hypothetical protein
LVGSKLERIVIDTSIFCMFHFGNIDA